LRPLAPARDKIQFRPKKRLGQHFLINTQIISQIIDIARFRSSDRVLEIGPGKGALTLPLAARVDHLTAVEKDAFLARALKEKLSSAGMANVTVINEDILSFDIRSIISAPTEKVQLIGNLPYNITSPLLEKITECRDSIQRSVLMLQEEVARRIVASPGTKVYGSLSLLVQYYALPRLLMRVLRDHFRPRPKVDSAVLELDFGRPYHRRARDEEAFKGIVRGAFSHRRKKLINSLGYSSHQWNRDILLGAMEKCAVDPGMRAENLSMDDFLCLTEALAGKSLDIRFRR
jgi:16S rRNA (adenine1518-N6/adenine1519-N6)-dimethyltransferase